ncbi:hypothetical protein [Polyangium sp. 15x6]|uniref:hypothetical protein n=1 Tax=Polyangium sp. 15x6 TaxID=3042687 RepID=UPI00249C7CE9|nr:hypothetical protein [Polyangium sp. 15x6]MDI3286236.1 hypothetical protein [Polyangium sp. 15x6]
MRHLLPSGHRLDRPRPRSLAGVAFLLPALLLPAPANAHGGGVASPPIEVPPPPPGDGATALQILKDVEAKAQDPRSKKAVADAVTRSKKALERAHGARASGDAPHARLLDGLALEWAETARDLLRAAEAEQAAAAVADKAKEASTQAERARALLEETQARRGRAEAELERATAEEKEAREAAGKAEDARIAAGKGKDKPAKKDDAKAPKKAGGGAAAVPKKGKGK